MLDLWRPPHRAGDPIGCLATTFTFGAGLFDEQCLARFLEIDSEPNREDLAFLLERENLLGGVYAGVLVDHTQAGVEHSLRWDVLPVRIRGAKQHAKLSLLVWSRHVRIIVSSANLTEAGYRSNYEVGAAVDLTPEAAEQGFATDSIGFLRALIGLVPAAGERPPEVARATSFLDVVERRISPWIPAKRSGVVGRHFICTLPSNGSMQTGSSSLESVIHRCRQKGPSPHTARIASPFFDLDDKTNRATSALCKLMSRDWTRELCLCLPGASGKTSGFARLAAPKSLLTTPSSDSIVKVMMLPGLDADKNRRPWHAKMIALSAEQYSALVIGSSNFTCAGLGIGAHRNAEVNLLTIAERGSYAREPGELDAIWPSMVEVSDPNAAEWVGSQASSEEEEQFTAPPLPEGFLRATFRAGTDACLILRLDPLHLPDAWSVQSCGQHIQQIYSSASWTDDGCPSTVALPWPAVSPPEKLAVIWAGLQAFMAINVENGDELPPPLKLDGMSADDMLHIIAASDPSAAFRVWARTQQVPTSFDDELDSATAIDLDPLRRHDLQSTFLHRVRQRARILGQLRAKLQRPIASNQALEWRLRGLVGIEALAMRFASDLGVDSSANQSVLALADFIIVLSEVDYQPADGFLSKQEFDKTFKLFLLQLVNTLEKKIDLTRDRIADDVHAFWNRVTAQWRT